jgi:diphthine-ammonia ligase
MDFLLTFSRARVEIKPILYLPTDDDGVATREMETGLTKPAPSQAWSAQYSDLHDSCCQIHTIGGRICSAVVSVTTDIATKICSTAGQLYYTEENLKAMARFFAFQITKILADNHFSWDSITVCLLHNYVAAYIRILTSISWLKYADVAVLLFGR